jgi:hypothetical protein
MNSNGGIFISTVPSRRHRHRAVRGVQQQAVKGMFRTIAADSRRVISVTTPSFRRWPSAQRGPAIGG